MPPWCSAARLLGRQQGDGRMADDGGGPLRAVEVQQDAAQALVVLQVLQRCMACILNLRVQYCPNGDTAAARAQAGMTLRAICRVRAQQYQIVTFPCCQGCCK